MSEIVVLDAVSVATIARAARDLARSDSELSAFPDAVAEAIRALADIDLAPDARDALLSYAVELDEIAEAAVLLDQHEHEIEHQLRWWSDRAAVLEAKLTGHPADDVEVIRAMRTISEQQQGRMVDA